MSQFVLILILISSISFAAPNDEVGVLVKPNIEQPTDASKSSAAPGAPVAIGSGGTADKTARMPNESAAAKNSEILNYIAEKSGW